eukprot:GHVN01035063.1.p1 GENE.GHVN01035063.1~~GHVN01035063.1.p1  ORF type:complete len:910 (+),score=131.48 GHVN01035063.1:5343-8072(+)
MSLVGFVGPLRSFLRSLLSCIYAIFTAGLQKVYSLSSLPHGPPRSVRNNQPRYPDWSKKSCEGPSTAWQFWSGEATLAHSPLSEYVTGNVAGRQIWTYQGGLNQELTTETSFDPCENANPDDIPYRSQMRSTTQTKRAQYNMMKGGKRGVDAAHEALVKGAEYWASIQCDDGHWAGDYGGPHFLTPGVVIATHVTQTNLSDSVKKGLRCYMLNHQQADGGWGIHIEGASGLFCTVLNYVALRLLGLNKDNDAIIKARTYIHDCGGAIRCPQWCKIWLSLLGVFEWDGIHPVLPELFLLPAWLPFHPGRLWCHSRMVYLAIAYLYGVRFRPAKSILSSDIINQLRSELFVCPYNDVKWKQSQNYCSHPSDTFHPVWWLQRIEKCVMGLVDRFHIPALRRRALKTIRKMIIFEDEFTNFINLGPVNKAMNMVCRYHINPDDDSLKRHMARLPDYLWLSEDGLKMAGEPGGQSWETAFSIQAMVAVSAATGLFTLNGANKVKGLTGSGEAERNMSVREAVVTSLRKGNDYMQEAQVRAEHPAITPNFRVDPKGGWGFSMGAQNWPVSDCTAEALISLFDLADAGLALIRLEEAVGVKDVRQGPTELSFIDDATSRFERWSDVIDKLKSTDGIVDEVRKQFKRSETSLSCGVGKQISLMRLVEGIEWILKNQNTCGGWSTYEPYRTTALLEYLNPTEVFGDVMIDYPWTECTASCVKALVMFNKRYPFLGRRDEIEKSVIKGCKFLLKRQEESGGWYGAWGVCYTYGSFFATSALKMASDSGLFQGGELAFDKCARFLMQHQLSDGGWAESFESCRLRRYVSGKEARQDGSSDVLSTSWAILTLLNCGVREDVVFDCAMELIISKQTNEGDFKQTGIAGQFNCTVGISYSTFRNSFPLMALAEYIKVNKFEQS